MTVKKQACFNTSIIFLLTAGLFSFAISSNTFKSISGDISDISFDTAQKVYHATENIEIPQGKNVILPGGIVILFNKGTSLTIKGGCTVSGTEASPVFLSSIRDPIFNNESSLAAPFDWEGVTVLESAGNVNLQHITVKYAKFPFISQAPSVRLTCAQRSNTGIAKFIINQDTLPVPQDKCFNFPPVLPSETPDLTASFTTETELVPTPIVMDSVTTEISWWKRPATRWTIGGIGIASLLASGGCWVGYDTKEEEGLEALALYEQAEGVNSNRTSLKTKASSAGKLSQNFKKASIVSGIIGVLFLTGFGLTFYF